MRVIFCQRHCQCHSNKKKFGLCDDPSPSKKPAYIDEIDGAKWIAVVINENRYDVTFTAVDNCIEIIKEDGKMAKRCDGMLTYESSLIFVELKVIGVLGNKWVKYAEKQLRTTIGYFEKSDMADDYTEKMAYIANREHPKFKSSQSIRMDQFLIDTGYVLRIENRIILP